MKRFLLVLLPVTLFAQTPKPVYLSGKLKLAQPVTQVYLSYRAGDVAVLDSVQPKNGTFRFQTTVAEPTLASVRVKFNKQSGEKEIVESVPVFLEPGKLTFTASDSLKNYTVTGSSAHADFLELAKFQKPYNEALENLYAAWDVQEKAGNKAAQDQLEQQIDSVDKALKENVYRTFIKKQPQSPVALYAVKQYAGYSMDGEAVAPLFESLPAATKQWPSALVFKEAIETAKKTGLGKLALDFTQTDTAAVPVSLSQFRGKYVLVDFWASWCGPCRAENPNVVTAFHQFNNKGFTVLGVSLDRPNGKERWLKAIHDDSLTWTHVSDLKFWDNAVAKLYGVRAIPQNFLIDPQGKIIGRNLRGSALLQKLTEVLAPKGSF